METSNREVIDFTTGETAQVIHCVDVKRPTVGPVGKAQVWLGPLVIAENRKKLDEMGVTRVLSLLDSEPKFQRVGADVGVWHSIKPAEAKRINTDATRWPKYCKKILTRTDGGFVESKQEPVDHDSMQDGCIQAHGYKVEDKEDDINSNLMKIALPHAIDQIRKWTTEEGHSVLIHCEQGISRSGTVTVGFILSDIILAINNLHQNSSEAQDLNHTYYCGKFLEILFSGEQEDNLSMPNRLISSPLMLAWQLARFGRPIVHPNSKFFNEVLVILERELETPDLKPVFHNFITKYLRTLGIEPVLADTPQSDAVTASHQCSKAELMHYTYSFCKDALVWRSRLSRLPTWVEGQSLVTELLSREKDPYKEAVFAYEERLSDTVVS